MGSNRLQALGVLQNLKAVKINRRSLLINSSLLLLSTAFALLLSEMAFRIVGFEALYVSPERDRFWKYDPLLGWAHEPGQSGIFETKQFRTEVRINELGLRDRSHSYERQGDTRRILVLGDSFAWGYGVDEPERFSQRLEEDLEVEVINAGVSGYSTDQELLWYENEGIKYETDLVIVVVTGNDVGDNDRELVNNIYYKPRFVFKDGQLVPTGFPVAETSRQGKFIYSLSQRSALAYFVIQQYFELRASYGKMNDPSDKAGSPAPNLSAEKEPFKLTIALLDEMRSIAASRNANFMVVSTDRWWNLRSGETYKDFVATMEKNGFLVLDVESMPGFDSAEMVIPDDGHWSRDGHEFVADEIKEFIESNQLIDKSVLQ